jgi:hypothetical protein
MAENVNVDMRVIKRKLREIKSSEFTSYRRLWKSRASSSSDERLLSSSSYINVGEVNNVDTVINEESDLYAYDNNEISSNNEIIENNIQDEDDDQDDQDQVDEIIIDKNDDFDDIDEDIDCNEYDIRLCKIYSRLDKGIPDEYKDFNIIDYTLNYLNECQKKSIRLLCNNDDSDSKLSNETEVTKKECAVMFSHFIASENISEKTSQNLFSLLSKLLPTVNWPISQINGNTYLKLDDYAGLDSRTLQFDACTNNCIVYVGCNIKSIKCQICNSDRFLTCPKCYKNKSYESCNHFYDRTPISRIWYRPLSSLIPFLLSKDFFLKSINYIDLNYNTYYVSDVRSSSNYIFHYQQMCNNFNIKKDTTYKNVKDLVMVNLLLSEFYDGMQVYKSRIQSFWPLMISILNLPLSMRNKPGVGSFLIALFLGKLNTPVERFVLEECLAQELVHFNDGLIFKINNISYLVQIRLICTILDTKGFEETLHVQASNSYSGCFVCNLGKGFSVGGRQVVINGHRRGLPIGHFLRILGQSKKCCPQGYYERHTGTSSALSKKNNNHNYNICYTANSINFSNINSIKELKAVLPCLNESHSFYTRFLNYLKGNDGSKHWIWYHGYSIKRFHYDNFQNELWFPHCDYRSQLSYERKKTFDYYNDYRTLVQNNITNKAKMKAFNGVKDVWHLYRLKYAKVEQDIMWDPFHAIYNVCKYVILNWKDERSKQYDISFCKDNSLHYYLYEAIDNYKDKSNDTVVKSNAPWIINEKTQTWIETIIYEILVPRSLSNSFQLKWVHIFHNTGQLRSTAEIQVITVLMKLILTIVSQNNEVMTKSYKLYYLMLSEDISLLMSPIFHKESDIELLQNKLLELTCMGEGFFPPGETRIPQHQLYCISHHLHLAGSVKNFWAAPGERMLKCIKDCVKTGGSSFDVTTIKKYSKYENAMIDSEYSCEGEFFKTNFFEVANNQFYLNIYKNNLFNSKKSLSNIVTFNYGIDSFLMTLLLYVKKNSISFTDACNKSILFRLYVLESQNPKYSQSLFSFIICDIAYNDAQHQYHFFCREIFQYCNTYAINQFDKANIYGTEFQAMDKINIPYKNSEKFYNDYLINNWFMKDSYSSWFKFKDYYKHIKVLIKSKELTSFGINSWYKHKINSDRVSDEHDESIKVSYGQFHYFFEIKNDFPDIFINNMKIGCATLRDIDIPNNTSIFIDALQIKADSTFDYRDHYYIDLSDVFPTNIMTVAVNAQWHPIQNRKNANYRFEEMKKFYEFDQKNIKYILFFELDPERKSLMRTE